MVKPQLDVTNPGDAEIEYAWKAWQRALVHSGYSEVARQQAREWREMYLALLARKQEADAVIARIAQLLSRLGELADAGGVLGRKPEEIERWLRQ